MAKDLIEDIKRPKRNLQDVLPSAAVPVDTAGRPRPVVLGGTARQPAHRRWPVIVSVFLVIIVPSTYFASIVFGRATVSVVPRRVPFAVSGKYRTLKLPSAAASSTTLGFQTMTIRGKESTTVPAGDSMAVAEQASGTIVVMNRYSRTAQKLVANTRFETPDGKIYRIKEAILVPGYTLIDGTLTPGELTAKVIADRPGPDYNGAWPTFTVPGFKGDPRFQTITARGETPFTGGFTGNRKTVDPAIRSAAESDLARRLKERLLAEAINQTPGDYVWYPNGVFWRLAEASTTEVSSAGEAEIALQAELVAPIFSRAELSQTLARRLVPAYDGAPVRVEGLEQFNFQPVSVLSDPERLTEFDFTLEGKGVLVWQFETAALLRDLAGRRTYDYQAVFIKYPSIVSSSATVNPPWLISFPADPKRISLTIEAPPARMSTTTEQYDTLNGD